VKYSELFGSYGPPIVFEALASQGIKRPIRIERGIRGAFLPRFLVVTRGLETFEIRSIEVDGAEQLVGDEPIPAAVFRKDGPDGVMQTMLAAAARAIAIAVQPLVAIPLQCDRVRLEFLAELYGERR
jgi:hypothetical protein